MKNYSKELENILTRALKDCESEQGLLLAVNSKFNGTVINSRFRLGNKGAKMVAEMLRGIATRIENDAIKDAES